MCIKAVSIPVSCSDHNLIAVMRKTKVPKQGQKFICKRTFKNFQENEYVAEVSNIDWSEVTQEQDPNKAVVVFNNLITKVIDKHAPIRKQAVRNVAAPWLDKDLKQYMKHRDEVRTQAIKTNQLEKWNEYRKLRNFVTKLNKNKKRLYYQKKINEVKSDSKKVWSTLNELMGKKTRSDPTFLEGDGIYLTKPREIANYLSQSFTNKIKKLRNAMEVRQEEKITCQLIRKYIMQTKNCTFEFAEVTEDDVKKLLKESKEKPSGIDNIEVRLLKMVVDFISLPVSHIINLSLRNNIFPSPWKMAKLIPLIKNNKEPLSGQNSRPISLLPALSKIMEKVVYDQIQEYFTAQGLNTIYQHAYKMGHSTTTALTQITDHWLQEIDNKKIVGTIFLDLSAAFDLLDHTILLNKLKCYGFLLPALRWLESYLSNREYKVYFNGNYSDVGHMDCGVPQGSCLGPLLFSIFTNDLPLVLQHATMAIYADDTTLFASAQTDCQLNNILNDELALVTQWIRANKLVVNVKKTKCMVVGTKHLLKTTPMLHLTSGNMIIEQVDQAKLLGVIVDSRLSWTSQINYVLQKMGRSMGIIKHCRECIPRWLTKQLVQSLVLSYLDYASVVWSNTSENNLHKLQVAQNKAARIVLGCPYRTNVRTMHNSLAWLTVKCRLKYFLITFIRNIILTKIPKVIHNKLSFFSDNHSYGTRQTSVTRCALPCCKTNQMQRTVCYRAMVAWNALPGFLLLENSKRCFQKKLKVFLFIQE